MTIFKMRQERPAYNIISNNCQNFAVRLLDAIQVGAHHQFATSFAVYQAATGDGTIKDLFVDAHPEEQKIDPAVPTTGIQRTDTVQNAQNVMDANTTKLDNHSSDTKSSGSWFSRGKQRTDTVQNAQNVMDENTTELDNHKPESKSSSSWFSRGKSKS